MYCKDPEDFSNENEDNSDRSFRAIDLSPESEVFNKVKCLDQDQREVVNIIYNYAVKFKLATKHPHNPWPIPPLLMVHGGAGSGTFISLKCNAFKKYILFSSR